MKKILINLSKYIDDFDKFIKPKTLYITFIAIGVLALLWDLRHSSSPPDAPKKIDISTVDTLIPEGYVLVPIDIQNYAALDSMIGSYGVVDLFAPTGTSDGSKRVAQKVKIIRAPLNPSQFAVLIKEENSTEIARYPGAFYVMVQNPTKQGAEFTKKFKRSAIITEDI